MEEYGKLRRLPLPGQADADWWPRTRWPKKTEKKKYAVLQEKMCRACCEEPTQTDQMFCDNLAIFPSFGNPPFSLTDISCHQYRSCIHSKSEDSGIKNPANLSKNATKWPKNG